MKVTKGLALAIIAIVALPLLFFLARNLVYYYETEKYLEEIITKSDFTNEQAESIILALKKQNGYDRSKINSLKKINETEAEISTGIGCFAYDSFIFRIFLITPSSECGKGKIYKIKRVNDENIEWRS